MNYIKKSSSYCGTEHIMLDLDDVPTYLPYFKKGKMYKGMEVGKQYTLEELGL